MTGNAAVPKQFLDAHLSTGDNVPPGHRFSLFFPYWNNDWTPTGKNKVGVLKKVIRLSPDNRKMLYELIKRQDALSQQAGDRHFLIRATSTSPFMTGIGNEHPLENGFSFLFPYGLPYLPGSSVKGVVRRAAEELALGFHENTSGWDLISLWSLLGFDATSAYFGIPEIDKKGLEKKEIEEWRNAYIACIEKKAYNKEQITSFIQSVLSEQDQRLFQESPEAFFKKLADGERENSLRGKIHLKGALSFWDVFPKTEDENFLQVEVLTPHYSDYYSGNAPPADCGQPNPIPFLAVAPGCEFKFNILAHTDLMPKFLQAKWKSLIEKAFEHAFDWLGFGARTSIGYGQMRRGSPAIEGSHKFERPLPSEPIPENIDVWGKALLRWTPNDKTLTATLEGKKPKKAQSTEISQIPAELHKKLFKHGEVVRAKVTVRAIGNLYKIIKIEAE